MTSEYQEISSNKLLEAAKQFITNDDIKMAHYYLNLIKYSDNYNSIGAKIQYLYNLSLINKKTTMTTISSDYNILQLGRRIIKWHKTLDMKKYNTDTISTIIRILLNCVKICEDKSNELFAGWFLFMAKNIYTENSLQIEDINDSIKKSFPDIIQRLNQKFNDDHIELSEKKANLLRLSQQLEQFLLSESKYAKGDKVYLINSVWLRNMIEFITEFNVSSIQNKGNVNNKDKLFTANHVCLLYYAQDEDQHTKGLYCGPINNFLLTQAKEYWRDPLDSKANVYLRKDIENRKHFELINSELYTLIAHYFKNCYVIERECIDNTGTIEIFLFQIEVLFINESIREKNKEQLKVKWIQISKKETMEDLIKKIERIFITLLKELKIEDDNDNGNGYEYKMFIIEKKKKTLLEMILFYVNNLKSFKIKGEDLIASVKRIEEYFQLNNNTNNKTNNVIIVVEALSKTQIVQPFIKRITDKLYCSICNFQIYDGKGYHCTFCSQAIYCSEKCKNMDHSHLEFHRRMASFYEASLKAEEVQQIKLEQFLDNNSKHGLVVIKNTGGMDFLITAVHILSHCQDLTKFFLSSNKYIDNTGKANNTESLVSVYTELIYQLWVGLESEIHFTTFKTLFLSMLKNLSNMNNIDCFDILILLIDRLHGELNLIQKKPDNVYYYDQTNGENDAQTCRRWWLTHKKFNQSIIIDLFQGQIKKKIKCPFCKNISITFPPFLYIELPIPDLSEMRKIHFRVFPYNFNYEFVSVEMYDINKFTSIKDIKNRILEYKLFKSSRIAALLYKDCQLIKILNDDVLIYDYIYTRYNLSDEEFVELEISYVELPDNSKNDLINFYVTPISFEEEKSFFFTYKKIVPLSYTRVIGINQKLTLEDLYKEIFKFYRRAMDDMIKHDTEGNPDSSYYKEFYDKVNDNSYIECEFNKFIEENSNKLFDVYFDHNFEPSDSWFFSGNKCEYCNSGKAGYCKCTLPKSTSLMELFTMQKTPRECFILVDLSKYENNLKQFYSQLIDNSDPRMALTEEINLYDCFDLFKKEEKAPKDSNYECPKCCRKVDPISKMEPYKSPNYLMIQIKRFKKKFEDLMDMINNKKNESFVQFPIENLDLKSYFIGEASSSSNSDGDNEIVYDLIGVINHEGDLKAGIYTSICKNEGKWFKFDHNNTITPLTTVNEVVTPNAYCLVYHKRETEVNKAKKVKEEEELLNENDSSINYTKKPFGEMKNI